jgi:hypothetical protein
VETAMADKFHRLELNDNKMLSLPTPSLQGHQGF